MEAASIFKQKLFCQICARQCQDKDGYKCHLQSATHKRNMEMVAENPDEFIEKYSREFETGILDILKRLYENKWVSANQVYSQYMQDRFSVHLTATKWTTLSAFIQYLSNKNKCRIKALENDIMITYVDNSPDLIKEKKKIEQKLKDEKRKEMLLAENIFSSSNIKGVIETEKIIKDVNPEELKGFSFMINKKNIDFLNKKRDLSDSEDEKQPKSKAAKIVKKTNSHIWIRQNLIVRIKDKNVKIKNISLYNQKAVVKTILKSSLAGVELLSDKSKINIDQNLLEPVIPQVGAKVKIISESKYIGETAELIKINLEEKSAEILLSCEDKTITLSLNSICKFI